MDFLYTLAGIRNPALDQVFSALTYMGTEIAAIVIAFTVYWCISKKDALYIMANVLIGTMINSVAKFFCRVPRPFVRDPEFRIVESARSGATGYSFPSGHSQTAVTLTSTLCVLYKKRAVWIISILAAVLVCFSRMYLGVHYPTDVLGGIAAALITLAALHRLMRAAEKKPGLISVIFGIGAAVTLIMAAVIEFVPWGDGIDQDNWSEAVSTLNLCGGCMLAIAVFVPVERKYIRFETKAVWWVQVLKTVLGLAVLMGARIALKPLMTAVFGTLGIAGAIRYFLIAGIGLAAWPMTFRFFERLGKKA